MAKLEPAFEKTLGSEGEYVDHPADRGGPTKFGISSRAFPHLDIKRLTVEDAREIYRKRYWNVMKLSMLKEQSIADEIFDTGVNMGPKTAVEVAQHALNYLGHNLRVDGAMGPITMNALNDYRYVESLLKVLNGVQFAQYLSIIRSNPSQKVFARGWLKRVTL